ncbi:phage terminase small subunit P27 family [Epibacterium sp. Ofav1-8]|jgi:P27 family predicted phage terminase small subunit|uniref:phage terminase small subunit P27 family n=2 Tax=unclassified Epibacterium TaxID=2639179 RepID=UPI001EF521FE|nr:phage terminase small subunit P27 family [Epibacterium sp. Ofav1-8]MCG7623197.1 phage terminase small subunit P27 family [Epibacterium sp. Ofav1-8]
MKGRKPNLENVIPMKGDMPKEVPAAPDWMDEIARDVWDELVPELVKKERMELLFKYQFSSYCVAVANFITSTNTVAMEGQFYDTGKGRNGNQKRHHPALKLQEASAATMRRDAALFGLSPVDEARLGAGSQGDLFDEVMKQLNGTD